MPLKESYVIWNNKGGVGKSTLTFHLATEYARCNPTEKVVVIDLCPQANVSMALLSSRAQHGSRLLPILYNDRKTVSWYLQRSIQPGPMIRAEDFALLVQNHNREVPDNLFLLCGDMCLELVGRHLEHERSGLVLPMNNPWLNVTSCMRSFIEGSPGRVCGLAENKEKNVVVFVDTNPAFAVYTEIALAAARKLLIPINADDFSVDAVRAMLDLVYGIRQQDQHVFEAYKSYMFSHKAALYNLRRPEIHLLISNRTTRYNTRAANAFGAIGEENISVLYQAYELQEGRACFSQRDQQIGDIEAFKNQYSFDLQDFHTAAIQSLHIGCPLAQLSGKVEFEAAVTTVHRVRIQSYCECLNRLVGML